MILWPTCSVRVSPFSIASCSPLYSSVLSFPWFVVYQFSLHCSMHVAASTKNCRNKRPLICKVVAWLRRCWMRYE
uniref:Uncharacterized protein n=1 Tax=Triticum urartu TaxID=4572 RepID=A0A8R7P0B2_TRIUA